MLNHMFSMNREQFKALMEKTDLAFLPVSPMEAHRPHLPLGSDVLRLPDVRRRRKKTSR